MTSGNHLDLEDIKLIVDMANTWYKSKLEVVTPRGFPSGLEVKRLPAMQEMQEQQFQSLDWEDRLEEGMTAHSIIPAEKSAWT